MKKSPSRVSEDTLDEKNYFNFNSTKIGIITTTENIPLFLAMMKNNNQWKNKTRSTRANKSILYLKFQIKTTFQSIMWIEAH